MRCGKKHSMRQRAILACLAGMVAGLPPAPAGGAMTPDSPAAYAWSVPVTVADDNGVHGMRLPSAVYLHAQSARLADVRLFDRRGLPVPYALRQPATDTYTDARELPLRIFPLDRQPDAPAPLAAQGDFKLELRTDSDGRLLSVTSGGPTVRMPATSPASRPAVDALVLDLGIASRATPPTVTALRFAPPAGQPTYSAQVWLEASDDLRDWRPLGMADLQWLAATDGAILACDTLAFEPAQFRYARLTWRGGTPAIFAGISALTFNQRQSAPALDHAVLAPQPGRMPGDLVYKAGIGIPAERAGMQFATPNAVYAAMLGSYRDAVPPVASAAPLPPYQRRHHHLRDHLHRHQMYRHDVHRAGSDTAPVEPQEPQDPFVPVASATFYDITQDGRRRRSGGLPLPATQLAQWVVRPYSPQSAAMPLSQAPKLELSWTPATLLFLANGNGPYTLAFGRAGATSMEHDIGHIAPGYTEKELRAVPKAEAGDARQTVAAVLGVPGVTAAMAGNAPAPVPAGPAGGAAGNTTVAEAASVMLPSRTAVPPGRWDSRTDQGLLWGVLLAGVGALAYLTVRLLKQPAGNGS